jgi:hypothetical protein
MHPSTQTNPHPPTGGTPFSTQLALAQVFLVEAQMLSEHHGGILLWLPC